MKKISKQLQKLAEAILEAMDDEDKKVLEEGSDEDKLAEVGDKILNSLGGFKSKLESKGREAVYQGIDAKVFEDTELEEIIGKDKFGKIKQAKGVDKHVQLTAAYKEAIKALKEAKAGAGSTADAKAFQEQLSKVQSEFEAFKVDAAKALEAAKVEVASKYDAEILSEKLYNVAATKGNLADGYKDEKFIRKMVVSEMLDKATEKGLKIDPKTLEIKKEDGTPFFVGGGKQYGIDALLEETISENWRKKSDSTPADQVSAGGGQKSVYVKADPIRGAASRSAVD